MLLLEVGYNLLVFLLGLLHDIVPVLVELLVLIDVSDFNFLSFLNLILQEFLSSLLEVLVLQLSNSVLCHFSLYKLVDLAFVTQVN